MATSWVNRKVVALLLCFTGWCCVDRPFDTCFSWEAGATSSAVCAAFPLFLRSRFGIYPGLAPRAHVALWHFPQTRAIYRLQSWTRFSIIIIIIIIAADSCIDHSAGAAATTNNAPPRSDGRFRDSHPYIQEDRPQHGGRNFLRRLLASEVALLRFLLDAATVIDRRCEQRTISIFVKFNRREFVGICLQSYKSRREGVTLFITFGRYCDEDPWWLKIAHHLFLAFFCRLSRGGTRTSPAVERGQQQM